MKVLIVATHVWPAAARTSIALAQVGFSVASIAPAQSLVRLVTCVARYYTYAPKQALDSIANAIQSWQPDLLVCTDDQAVKHLHDLHAQASKLPDAAGASLRHLIELSLGNPSSFPAAAQKSLFMTLATSAGVRCPKTWLISNDRDDLSIPHVSYPIMVKSDGTFGGRGVRRVENENQARTAIVEFTLPLDFPDRIKRALAKFIVLSRIKLSRRRTVCLQEEVIGQPANRAVVCCKGKVLAGISVEALETEHDLGPASIVRLIHNHEMTAIAQTMVERFQLSGFIGFDFVLDSKNAAWLIEMNPRVTPICHLHLEDGTSLPASLFAEMTGTAAIPNAPVVNAETVVLFPGGFGKMHRDYDLSSIYMSSYHDVPWDEPELIRACIHGTNRRILMHPPGQSNCNVQ
jgi:ATP-grasp domain